MVYNLKQKSNMQKLIILFSTVSLFVCTPIFGQEEEEKEEIDTTLYYIANNYETLSTPPYRPGELLEFKASIGWIKAAEATFGVSDIIYTTNNKPTYRIDINAKTVGIFDLVSSVRDNWGTLC